MKLLMIAALMFLIPWFGMGAWLVWDRYDIEITRAFRRWGSWVKSRIPWKGKHAQEKSD